LTRRGAALAEHFGKFNLGFEVVFHCVVYSHALASEKLHRSCNAKSVRWILLQSFDEREDGKIPGSGLTVEISPHQFQIAARS
jgi:hypothetical protein